MRLGQRSFSSKVIVQTPIALHKLKEASNHKSAKTQAGNVHVTHDLDHKINGFPGLVKHFYVKFGDPSCIVF